MEQIEFTPAQLDATLERFFNGETSRAEEIALEQYFSSGAEIPEQYEPYRAMFGWYASGMKEDELPHKSAPLRRKPWRPVIWGGSVAAAVAVLLCIALPRTAPAINDISCYEGSFIMRDGKIMTGSSEIQPDIEAALLDAACLEMEIDSRMSMLGTENSSLGDMNLE